MNLRDKVKSYLEIALDMQRDAYVRELVETRQCLPEEAELYRKGFYPNSQDTLLLAILFVTLDGLRVAS